MNRVRRTIGALSCLALSLSCVFAEGCRRESPFGPGLTPAQMRDAEHRRLTYEEAVMVRALENAKTVTLGAERIGVFRVTNRFEPDSARFRGNPEVAGYPIVGK